jgi:Pentapeptide repeats (8 copies)
LSQVNLEDTVIENERLELGAGTIYFLGPRLTLRNCTLVLRVPARDLIIPEARFVECTIDIKKELKNFHWEHAVLKGCRFTGRLSGNDFGRWPTSDRAPGSIEDCDFTEARLDGCRFIGCDLDTLRLPSWPCFTIQDPARRSRELNALEWPGQMGIAIKGFSTYPESTAAITYWAPAIARWSGSSVEEIRAVLEKLDGVFY